MFIAWDADGNIVATLDSLVTHDPATGAMVGLVDMQTHEATGGRMREIAEVERAVGAGTWIEELGAQAHDFRVEVDPAWTRTNDKPFAVVALVHKSSRVKRKRADAEKRVLAAVKVAQERGAAVDLEPAIGLASTRPDAPDRHLRLGPDGRGAEPVSVAPVEPPFPLLRPRHARERAGDSDSPSKLNPDPDAG